MKEIVLGTLACGALLVARSWAQVEIVMPREQEPAEAEAPEETSSEEEGGEKVETLVQRSEHEVIKANTLWDLAAYYYKDPWQWPRIHEANKDKIKDPHWIYPGQVFVIPGLDKVVRVASRAAGEKVSAVPAPAPAPAPPSEPPAEPAGGVAVPDGLSAKLPESFAGHQPAVYRLKVSKGWKADGTIRPMEDRDVLAQGDEAPVRLDAPAEQGWRYAVYRRAAPTEQDTDEDAQYLQRVGTVKILRESGKAGKREYKALIIRSGGALEAGDLLKREI